MTNIEIQESPQTVEELEIKLKDQRAFAQMRIARYSLAAMIVTTGYLVSPYGPPVEKLNALDTSLGSFYVATATICAAYMGFTSWMSKK